MACASRRGPHLVVMYSRSSEPVQFERDCAAVLVPQGDSVTLPAGSFGYITQALGGSYTVFVEGNLFRIAGQDGDAIGKEPAESLSLPENASDEEVDTADRKQENERKRRRRMNAFAAGRAEQNGLDGLECVAQARA